MLIFIYCFSLLIIAVGVIILIKPAVILDFIGANADQKGLYGMAILARLVLGLILIVLADISRYPLVMTCLGWLAIGAAAVLLLMGRRRFAAMLTWMMAKIGSWARIGGLAALLFGGFLLYAFV